MPASRDHRSHNYNNHDRDHDDNLNRAIQSFTDAVKGAEANIEAAIGAWRALQATFKKGDLAQRQSLTSWGFARIHESSITQVGKWMYSAHFESLKLEKQAEVRKTARPFYTDIWTNYYVLGKELITESLRGAQDDSSL